MIILHKKWNNYTKIIKLKIDEKRKEAPVFMRRH